MKRINTAEAFAVCEAIARDRACATKVSEYADGYRCAANDIAREISAKRVGRPPTPLERDVREAEIEARTLARVVAVAIAVVADVGQESGGADGIRKVLVSFFDDQDLPAALRRHDPSESATSLVVRRRESA